MERYLEAVPDGRKVFYPWGRVWNRGYVINAEHEFAQRRIQTNRYIFIGKQILWGGDSQAVGF
jgi:hypothetical protein